MSKSDKVGEVFDKTSREGHFVDFLTGTVVRQGAIDA